MGGQSLAENGAGEKDAEEEERREGGKDNKGETGVCGRAKKKDKEETIGERCCANDPAARLLHPEAQGSLPTQEASRKWPSFKTSPSLPKGTDVLDTRWTSARPVPPGVGKPSPTSLPGLSGAAAVVRAHLTFLATSPFFNKTMNKKVGQKGLSTQNTCCVVLALNESYAAAAHSAANPPLTPCSGQRVLCFWGHGHKP